jgi:acetyl/propionyl-CoA carboxylase alpha subunit
VGFLSTYKIPVGEGIRVDNGIEEGMDVPIYYDPMLSKLVTYGKTREESIELMIKAIDNYQRVYRKVNPIELMLKKTEKHLKTILQDQN